MAPTFSPTAERLSRIHRHLPALDGIRAVAALGVMVTHVSFQTATEWAFLDRFDFFVPVFFALSAFVLWRGRDRHGPAQYYRNRIARIAPAYLVCVVLVILLLPDARTAGWLTTLANLAPLQIFLPDGLAPGLTHLWSLCVEISFYVVMPLLALAVARLTRRARIAAICSASLLSLGWAYLPFVAAFEPGTGAVNFQIWPPAYTAWFAVGLLAAECEGCVPAAVQRVLRVRWPFWLAALAVAWVASRQWYGPAGLVHPAPDEFVRRVIAGALFAACVVVPYALAPRAGGFLCGPLMQALGRWSYSIFLWHMAVLSVVFPLLGVDVFSGNPVDFVTVLAATVALTIPVAAVSYTLVEEPGMRLIRGFGDDKKAQAKAAATRPVTSQESPA